MPCLLLKDTFLNRIQETQTSLPLQFDERAHAAIYKREVLSFPGEGPCHL